ncbi:sensor histidine kinase [Verrucomicrobia bacterium S94]|nr:sensor histidine kinase [Verrucomicrobia bacterium S94]
MDAVAGGADGQISERKTLRFCLCSEDSAEVEGEEPPLPCSSDSGLLDCSVMSFSMKRSGVRFFLMFFLALGAAAQGALDSIYRLRRMKPENAAEGRPVELQAQVVRTNPLQNGLFIFDGEEGVFVEGPTDPAVVKGLKQGDLVRIAGVTTAGGFAPAVRAESIEVVGHEPVPDGRPVQNNDFLSTGLDATWVQVRGRVLSLTRSANSKFIQVEVRRNARILNLQVPYSKENMKKLESHLFSFVHCNAVAGTVFNLNRQMVDRIFYVHSADDFRKAGTEFRMNVEMEARIHELMRFRMVVNRPIRTFGTVIHAAEGEIFIRNEKAGLRVSVPPATQVKPGDEVAVVGIVDPQPVSPAFIAGSVEVLGHSGPLEPITIDLQKDPIDARLNFNLIQVEAELVDYSSEYFSEDGSTMQLLRCRAGEQVFDVVLPADMQHDERLEPGAELRLTGLCNILKRPDRRWYLDVVGFRLEVRDAGDVEVLSPAPWWNTRRLLWFSGSAVTSSALFLIWIAALRKTVERQTRIISEKVEREAVMEERSRMARELHDNLEQGLAGASIQLSGCQRLVELNREQQLAFLEQFESMMENDRQGALIERQRFEVEKAAAKNSRALEVVENMVMRCSQESRATILELRGGLLEKMDLLSAVEISIEPLARECGAELQYEHKGNPVRLKLKAERNLLLFIKEAVSNAARHASPSVIRVMIEYQDDALDILVEDDGIGFDVSGSVKLGHFGLQGMRERAEQLHGELNVMSEKGKGTSICLKIPSLRKWLVS